ncbi:pyrrolo-quinoline quinone [Terriglobus albidus]|uniref:Pyrrolo-quinoline quinone n=1 Tax=Terriglobus albidus TaxID=1592106 RepID=A0A5B9E7P8_9BACT|nr:pyrrolo-quinoline quinone [Terriglobus albidus]QEE28108.1 pyrrolo-quinoline quinone [Terriglobus albidus]
MAKRRFILSLLMLVGLQSANHAQVLTAQYDNFRTSADLHETILKPSNVNSREFGKLFSRTVDGDVFAQPLYMPSLAIPGKGKRDVVFAATAHDSVYAFDVNGKNDAPLWKTTFINPQRDITALSEGDASCPFITPEVGITPTPVIDAGSKTMYVLARTKEHGAFVQKLHALDITNGKERAGSPVVISATVQGSGDGAVNGRVSFDPLKENPRAALLLVGGEVYVTWASSCDVGPYHGWIMAYDGHTLRQRAVLNTSPDGAKAGIWQSDAGPAADEEGNIYVATGNGDFNAANANGRNFGDSLLKLRLEGPNFVVRDFFTPFNQKILDSKDQDLGSQGPVLLPAQTGAHPHLLVIAGKEGKLYMLNRDKLGKFHEGSDTDVVQAIINEKGAYGAAAYWNGHIFLTDRSYITRDFALQAGQLVLKGATTKMPSPAATPIISADGTKNAILWVVSTKEWNEAHTDRAAVLHAYDANDISHELYNSEQNSNRDRADMTVRFCIPTVADGHIFIGARGRLDVYGLLNTTTSRR